MTHDDWIYAAILLISLLMGFAVKSNSLTRQYLSPTLGFLFILCTAGLAVWHSLITVIGFILLLGLCPYKFIHYISCIWCFGYLGFFRSCHLFDFNKPPAIANAVQLLITLRLIGIAFELSDTFQNEQALDEIGPAGDRHTDYKRLSLVKRYKNITVTPVDILCYTYCFIGLFTGPYYKYRTFYDFVHRSADLPEISINQLIYRLQEAPFFGVTYLILSHFYSVDYVRTAEFFGRGFFYRFWYMVVIFFIFRLRIYFAWKSAESICICAGLGAYPIVSDPASGEGPTNLEALDRWMTQYDPNTRKSHIPSSSSRIPVPNSPKQDLLSDDVPSKEIYDFTCIQNISVWGCECSPTVREGMRSWNQSVQYWLANNFHKRCFGTRNIRYIWTMLISAYWHGLHPGYYLSFLTVPFALNAESGLGVLFNAFSYFLPSGSLSFFAWLLKMRVFEYCAMGFLLLDAQSTLAYWHSIGYCVHVVLLVIIVLSSIIGRLQPHLAINLPPVSISVTEQLARQSERKVQSMKPL